MLDRLARFTAKACLVIACTLAAISIALLIGKWQFVPVLSASMRPEMKAGDLAITRPISAGDVQPGQVIVYRAPIEGSPLVIHRVMQVVHDGHDTVIKTKGDANSAPDAWSARLPSDAIVLERQRSVGGLGKPVHSAVSVGKPALLLTAFTLMAGVFVVALIWKPQTSSSEAQNEFDANMAG